MEQEPISNEATPEQKVSNIESRFGDKEQIIEAMMRGEIIEIGRIEDLYPDIPEHSNEVKIADVKKEHANEILGVKIQKGENVIRCVFKPANGESQEAKKRAALESNFQFYPRECAAYLVSEHFNFDVVPPTVIREVNGQIGALQLFLDHDYFKNYHFSTDEESHQAINSEDWQRIALLDWILANCERHMHNMMIRKNDPKTIAAIDHGIVLSGSNYFEMALRGPSLQLTHDNQTGRAKSVDIPRNLIAKIKKGISNQADLDAKLQNIEGLKEMEIRMMWRRIGQLIEKGKFLSKMNFEPLFGHSWLSDQYVSESNKSE